MPDKNQQANMTDVGEITRLLHESASGEPAARDQLASLVYGDLRRIAARRMSDESNHSLGVTGLVHEAFLRLDQTVTMSFSSRRHYFGAAAQAMRRILIERARYHGAQRRADGRKQVSIEEAGIVIEGLETDDLLFLDQALETLESFDAELANLVKLKFFVGLSTNEIAEVMESSPRTIERRWRAARAWLESEMT